MTLKNSRRDNELEKFKDKYDTYDISVTSTSATTSLSGTKADVVKDILLQNVGAQSVFFQLVNTATTITATSGSRLKTDEYIAFNDVGFSHLAHIASSGESTTLRVTVVSRGNVQ